jgi:hypothetical protein
MKTCKWGHPWTPENTYARRNGTKVCKICQKTPHKRSRTGAIIAPRIVEAIKAYTEGEKVASIRARFKISEETIYRYLPGLGLKKRGQKRLPPHWCEWCGDPLKSGRKRFCSRQHCQEYAADLRKAEGVEARCGYCDKPLPPGDRLFCDAACLAAHRTQKWEAIMVPVQRMRGNITVAEMAGILEISDSTVKTALAKIRAAENAGKIGRRAAA